MKTEDKKIKDFHAVEFFRNVNKQIAYEIGDLLSRRGH